jgi:hypothetical protein
MFTINFETINKHTKVCLSPLKLAESIETSPEYYLFKQESRVDCSLRFL